MIYKFQKLLKEKNINFYIVPTDDDHQSENVGAYYQARAYLSGFDGSAGTLIVTQDHAYLWTDGRYFIQAAKQLKDGIELMKMGQKNVPTIKEFLIQNVKESDVIAFDGTNLQYQFVNELKACLNCQFMSIDLFNGFWEDRPKRSCEKAFLYDIKYHGRKASDKINEIRNIMKSKDCSSHVLTTLDDIAWIFNIRGHDIPSSPMVLAFAIIYQDKSVLYLQDGVYDEELVNTYKQDSIYIKNYLDIYEDVKKLEGKVLLNSSHINYELYQNIHCDIVDEANPSQLLKSIKNEIEIKNTKNCHIKDGVAVTKFMYWLKHNKEPMDEMSVSDKLQNYREQQDLLTEISFTTICAFNENAALMHYHPTRKAFSKIEGEGLLLIDSGGQYLDGTTDITRTFVIGGITDIQKKHYTLVLKGMLALQNAVFLEKCSGQNLDILARAPIWAENLDYQCGTGHGVGHFLNVHEGPQGIRPVARFENEFTPFQAGMVVTDEPGIYLEGQYGIRIENELLTVKGEENEYGQFLKFEPLTFVPIDLDAIDADLLTYVEKKWLNDYHKEVYDKISPYLTSDEVEWLKKYTREI